MPLTVGTAGHIDHGKTALLLALTGQAGDQRQEERARGMTIHEQTAAETEAWRRAMNPPVVEAFLRQAPEGGRRILDLLAHYAPEPGWPLYQSFLRMVDFIAGMTDSYATEMAREMTGRSSPV